MDYQRPIMATLRTRCGCTRVKEISIVWPEYHAPLERVTDSLDIHTKYDFQTVECRTRRFKLYNVRCTEFGTFVEYREE